MAHRVQPRVLETCLNPGVSAFTMLGAVLGFLPFSSIPSIATSDTTEYYAEGVDALGALTGAWEYGVATYSSTGPTLTRTTILGSSNAGAAVNFTGTVRVGLPILANDRGIPRQITAAGSLGASDVNCTLRVNNASTIALTVPNDATLSIVGAKVGNSQICVFIEGAGVPTFTAGSGVTIVGTAPSGLAQNSMVVLNHTGAANTWSYA